MIYILLIIITLELGVLIYLNFKRLPEETKKEILRKVDKRNEGKVLTWKAPEEAESKAFKETLKNINK
jgi:hypothetical protein